LLSGETSATKVDDVIKTPNGKSVWSVKVCDCVMFGVVDLLVVSSEDDLDATPVITQGVSVSVCVLVCVCMYVSVCVC